MAKLFVNLAEVSKGQLVLGVALTKTGAKKFSDESVHASVGIVTATVPGPVQAGASVVAKMVEEDGERWFDHLELSPAATDGLSRVYTVRA